MLFVRRASVMIGELSFSDALWMLFNNHIEIRIESGDGTSDRVTRQKLALNAPIRRPTATVALVHARVSPSRSGCRLHVLEIFSKS